MSYNQDMMEIESKYLGLNKKAESKASAIVFVEVMKKVSHLVPIHFLDKPDNDIVINNSSGTFTYLRDTAGKGTYKPEHIGVIIPKQDNIFEDSLFICTLLHEIGHFVYMKDNYKYSQETKLGLNNNSQVAKNKVEDYANLFVIDYLETFPLWIQSAMSYAINAIIKANNLIEKGYDLKLKEFDGHEVYESLKEHNQLGLLKKEK